MRQLTASVFCQRSCFSSLTTFNCSSMLFVKEKKKLKVEIIEYNYSVSNLLSFFFLFLS